MYVGFATGTALPLTRNSRQSTPLTVPANRLDPDFLGHVQMPLKRDEVGNDCCPAICLCSYLYSNLFIWGHGLLIKQY